jgi:acyl-CoA thioesterase-1
MNQRDVAPLITMVSRPFAPPSAGLGVTTEEPLSDLRIVESAILNRPARRARRRLFVAHVLALTLAVLALASAGPAAQTVTPKSTRPRIVFLGDSLTAGYGLAPNQSVPSLIQGRLNQAGLDFEVVNAGVSGDTSAGGLSRLQWSLDGAVRILVVELGANDGLRGLPIAAMKTNLDTIIRRAQARGITVLLTGMEAPPNYGASYTSEFRSVFSSLAAEHKVAFVPFYLDGVAGIARLNIADGIHPNAEGNRIVAQTIWRALQPLLTQAAATR